MRSYCDQGLHAHWEYRGEEGYRTASRGLKSRAHWQVQKNHIKCEWASNTGDTREGLIPAGKCKEDILILW